MGARKKLQRQMIRHMMDGVITPDQARVMLGKKPRRAAGTYRAPQRQAAMAAKSAGRAVPAPVMPRGTGQAWPPGMPVPARPALQRMADSSSDPAQREHARGVLAGLDSGARTWVPPLPGLVRESQDNPDPWEREMARKAVTEQMYGKAAT
jgi:hypothetical protein